MFRAEVSVKNTKQLIDMYEIIEKMEQTSREIQIVKLENNLN